jgi:hypothetical protein
VDKDVVMYDFLRHEDKKGSGAQDMYIFRYDADPHPLKG